MPMGVSHQSTARIAVVGEEFAHLRHGFLRDVIHQRHALHGRIPMGLALVDAAVGAARVVPVLGLGMIKAELHALPGAGLGELLERVAAEGRGVDNIVGVGLRVKHREAVVVLGSDHDVAHAGLFGQGHPGFGIELHRIEVFGQGFVLGHRNFGVEHDPLADAGDALALPFAGRQGVQAPVDEQSEAGIAPPGHFVAAGVGQFGRFGFFQAVAVAGGHEEQEENGEISHGNRDVVCRL
jgi:hypothetical protein